MDNQLPSIVKVAFKAGFGAYLGFQAAKVVDQFVVIVLTKTLGTPEEIAGKIVDSIMPKKTN